jgi:hypothetical protein
MSVDPRPDELLEECGRLLWGRNAAVAWTDGLEPDEKAKACSRSGSGAWKAARPLREHLADADQAAAFFRARARKRNPVVTASGSGWDLVEYDGDRDELNAKHGLPRLPETLGWRSRRGPHLVYQAPPGTAPVKVQVDETGITVSADGYLVAAPAWRPEHGVVYALNGTRELVPLPAEVRELLLELGEHGRDELRARIVTGARIPTGSRHDALKIEVLRLRRAGHEYEQVVRQAVIFNRERLEPPLEERDVLRHARGLLGWAAKHPTEEEQLRARARDALRGEGRDPASRSASGWEEPVPIGTRETALAFRLELLPDWMAQWAADITAEKGAAADLGASLALGVVAGGIARNVQVSPRPGWYEPTCLYVIVALPPGQTKSPTFKAALRPVRSLERHWIEEWRQDQELAVLSGAIFEKRRKDLILEAAGDDELDSERLREMIEELDSGLGETRPQPQPRLLTEDVTPEGLADLLADHGRIVAASDEGGALFENMAGRYARGSTSWDLYNKAHSGVDIAIDRKSSGAVIVYDPSLTLVLATQPDMLRSLAGKPGAAGRGVLARPLYSLPAPVYRDRVTAAADADVLDDYARRIRAVYCDTPELALDEDGHPHPQTLTFSPPARDRFEHFEAELNRERRELGDEDLGGESIYLGWLSKLAGQTARLAAVLHVAAKWTGGFGATALEIDEATVDRAIELARYFRSHALGVFGLMGELPMQALAARILRWLAETELEPLTLRDVHRSRGKGTTAADVRVALRLLEEHGYVRLQEPPRAGSAGRASERVRLHPAIRNHKKKPDLPDTGSPASGMSGIFEGKSGCAEHPAAGAWKARDGVWRCRQCEPPAFRDEIVEEAR